MDRRGFTLPELALALALVGIVLAVTLPAFMEVLDRTRLDGAIRQMVSDLQEARSEAVATGWEYRVVGYRNISTNDRANQYRVIARRTAGVSWPADTAGVLENDTQMAGAWVDVPAFHSGITISASQDRFEVTFDSRGTSSDAATEFNPLELVGKNGASKSVSVSVVGGITSQ
jgi:prepilin-type N-terminal cleavage/methylation domain-containing protein